MSNCKDPVLYWWTCTWNSWRQAERINEDFGGSVMVVVYAGLKCKCCKNGTWIEERIISENKCHCFLEEAGRKKEEVGCNCDLKPSPGFEQGHPIP